MALFLFLCLAVSGCQTLGPQEETVIGQVGSAQGQWRGNAYIVSKKSGKGATLTLEIVAQEPSKMRMEVTGSFGVQLASVAMNDERVTYVLPREKRFVSAPSDSDALIGLIPIRIPPQSLLNLLFDRPLSPREWKCQKNESSGEQRCSHHSDSLVVSWKKEADTRRRFKIGSTDADIDMVIQEAKSNVEIGPDIFQLSPPKGYRRQIVR